MKLRREIIEHKRFQDRANGTPVTESYGSLLKVAADGSSLLDKYREPLILASLNNYQIEKTAAPPFSSTLFKQLQKLFTKGMPEEAAFKALIKGSEAEVPAVIGALRKKGLITKGQRETVKGWQVPGKTPTALESWEKAYRQGRTYDFPLFSAEGFKANWKPIALGAGGMLAAQNLMNRR